MKFAEKAVVFMATGGGVGNIRFAPGTFGSVIGLFLGYPISLMDDISGGLAILGFSVLAIWVSGQSEKYLNQKDPGCIVIDEIAGMMFAIWALPFNVAIPVIGFLLFRIIDITKLYPIRQIEARVQGGLGIVLDDLFAGLYVNLALRLGMKLLNCRG